MYIRKEEVFYCQTHMGACMHRRERERGREEREREAEREKARDGGDGKTHRQTERGTQRESCFNETRNYCVMYFDHSVLPASKDKG